MTSNSQEVHSRVIVNPASDAEWLVTNGLGGYASGTVSGKLTRRYHSILVAAPPSREGRFIALNALDVYVEAENRVIASLGEHIFARPTEEESKFEFFLNQGLPEWTFQTKDLKIQKCLFLNHDQNTVLVTYRLLASPSAVTLILQPGINFRRHDEAVSTAPRERYSVTWDGSCCEIPTDIDDLVLRMQCDQPAEFIANPDIANVVFEMERKRGYDSEGTIHSPGHFAVRLSEGQEVTITASIETREVMNTLVPSHARERAMQRRRALLQRCPLHSRTGIPARLIMAADQFLFHPPHRRKDQIWARAAGDQVRSVIAGYHWFGDWGRDTMISLEGLALTTGRRTEAGWILRTFAHYVQDGLIPNLFPEGQELGLYHTADATLWYFHALQRYLDFTEDYTTLRLLMPKLIQIAEAHLAGTRFGIKVDAKDGLLTQGESGYQLTWMDAKVGDWVVTPRRGKAVEINALWYNALCCLSAWAALLGQQPESEKYSQLAARASASFNSRFWCERAGYLYDVVDGEGGDDLSCRPNQLFAISLPHPVLDRERWPRILEIATRDLLTPVGLRTLSPHDPNYKPRYDGDLRSRDAAYHQGSVWAWLIGPYIDTWMKVHPGEPQGARVFLNGFVAHLDEACIGSISEIFDGDTPHSPRGCIAQAWSVAEVLRCWAKTAG
jgi:predicted glycogen debranching enzyme